MVKVKICGITNLGDAMWAVNLGTDMLGFIFFKDSPRKISQQKAREITAQLPAFVKKVGVFVNEDPKVVEKIAKACGFDILQFHGEETQEYCNAFAGNYEVIKALRVKDEPGLSVIQNYDVNYILLDTFIEDVQGGTGRTFNWDLAVKAKSFNRPIILSGGLSIDNVTEAIKKVQPFAVDVASSIERMPGKKDYEAMKEFIAKARRAG